MSPTDELQFDEERHEYSVNGRVIPSVTQIISAVGLYEFDFVSRETLAVAAERGRIVHQCIEWYERGELDESSIDPELSGYFKAWLRVRKENFMPKPDELEMRVYSKKYGYAGTLDMLLGHDGWINDHKTGQKDPAHGLQLSAYWLALHPNMAETPGRLTCDYLARDGSGELVDYPYEPLAWLAVLADYKWRAKNNKIRAIWK